MNKDRSLYSLKDKRPLVALAERQKTQWFRLLILVLCPLSLLLCPSCNPEAPWTTREVAITMQVTTVSAGFAECSFSTDKNAYYFINLVPVVEGVDPMAQQKQYMTLALDSAYTEYLAWRNQLLKEGEFNIAPFASHALQYGDVDYFFTGLQPETEYWIYAFVVNPETMKPTGKLYLQQIKTTAESILDIHFEYRIKGRWDYIYPVDTLGNIYGRFPYIATTMDSALMMKDDVDAITEYLLWVYDQFEHPEQANVLYGVKAVENDGWSSSVEFEPGHTYYTAIAGFDGIFEQLTLYKFHWTGDSCNMYFHDTDSANIMNLLREE
ncbi:MAG: hypothetical protein J5761_05680 [Paludibacteraceae bacterium]|nr:hypothetical protein [Paludibacteraceae bacterium]